MMSKSFLGPLFLALASSIWGGMYVSSKYVLDTIPPMTLLFMRYVLAVMVLTTICLLKRRELKKIRHWRWFFQIGCIGYFLSIGTQFVGTKLSNAHIAALITSFSPVFLSLFAIFILKEKMNRTQQLSILLAIVGLVLIIGLPESSGDQTFLGSLILIFTSATWGYYSVIARKASEYYPPLQLTTVGIWIAMFLNAPVCLTELHQWNIPQWFDTSIIFNVFFIGFIATAVAFFCWNKGLELTPSHQAGLFFFLQPIVGSILGWFVLGEQLTLSFIIGSLIILFSVYISISIKSLEQTDPHLEKP